MSELTLDEVLESETPYLDVFGTTQRSRGRVSGDHLNFEESLNLPSPSMVPDRAMARKIRDRAANRANAVLKKLYAKELKKLYRAEMLVEVQGAEPDHLIDSGLKKPKREKLNIMGIDEAKDTPGSGFLEGQTWNEWMKTFVEKGDDELAIEKPVAKANLRAVQRGKR